jgi:hypothetical protein
MQIKDMPRVSRFDDTNAPAAFNGEPDTPTGKPVLTSVTGESATPEPLTPEKRAMMVGKIDERIGFRDNPAYSDAYIIDRYRRAMSSEPVAISKPDAEPPEVKGDASSDAEGRSEVTEAQIAMHERDDAKRRGVVVLHKPVTHTDAAEYKGLSPVTIAQIEKHKRDAAERSGGFGGSGDAA